MNRTLRVIIIVVLAIAFAAFILPRVVLWTSFSIAGKGYKSPNTYEYLGNKWVCEEPYIWFEVGNNSDKGEAETEDGERIPVRFDMDRGTCNIYRESASWEVGEDSEPHIDYLQEDLLLHGRYKMNRKGTKVTLSISKDEIYDYQYDTLTFYRQDPAGTEESAVQP